MANKVHAAGGESASMKAAYVTEWCALGTVADQVSFGDVPAPPAPQKTQVLIGVKAASITGDDVALMQDTFAGGLAHSAKPSAAKPLVGGMDYAGVVLACGPNCKTLKVGDRVVGIMKVYEQQPGTWAERTIAPEKEVCKIEDDSISFVDAAAVAMGAFVDSAMIKSAGAAANGGRCLVLGASGALGAVLLQLLRGTAGHVTAVCSGKHAETATRMGAHEVIDYTSSPFGEQLAAAEKFDVVFDFVGGRALEREAAPLLAPGGRFITAVGPQQHMAKDQKLSCGAVCSTIGYQLRRSLCNCGWKYTYTMAAPYPPLKADVWKAAVIESGARAAIAEEVPFAEEPIRAAIKRVASHHAGGRVVINLETTATGTG